MPIKSLLAAALAAVLMLTPACTSWRDLSPQTVSSGESKEATKYEITFTDGAKIAAKAEDIQFRGDAIGVRPEGGGDFAFYPRDQIRSIRAGKFSGGKTAGLVGGIVAGVVGVIVGGIFAVKSACSTPNACN